VTDTASRSRFATDPHRPAYHFLPPANWLNDPNGVVHWRGAYHLFYQYNPHGAFHGTIHWGHAVSPDLVHWTHLPIALAPTPGGPDEGGCWSGCFVDNNGTPTLIYTGFRDEIQLPCLATGSDDLVTWTKYAENPILQSTPPDLDLLGFRDHCVWREDDVWYQIIGVGIRDVGGAALLYRSHDLLTWEYLHPLYVGDHRKRDPIWTGTFWECPDLFALGDRHVLLLSVWSDSITHYPIAYVGSYTHHRFTPDRVLRLDAGPSLYAPQSFCDEAGRRIVWGWLRESRSTEAQQAAGWSGVMALPRMLTPRDDGTIGQSPAPELQALRDQHTHLTIDVAGDRILGEVAGDALELIALFEPGSAEMCGVSVRCSSDGSEATHVGYDRANGRLLIDTRQSSLDHDTLHRDLYTEDCSLDPGESIQLHIFVDRSVIEVFANGRVAGAVRVYPTRSDSVGIRAWTQAGTARLTLDRWTLRSIW
jgi:beta-fructofuranosidase